VFGEQVATAKHWLDQVCDDLEAVDYTIGAAVLPACGVGQDHKRERIYLAGYANGHGESGRAEHAKAQRVPRIGGFPRTVARTHGVSERVGRLRAYGNAIVPQLAAEFIQAAEGGLR
jgi:DNA (cytosine-5)-methyltransferase 1